MEHISTTIEQKEKKRGGRRSGAGRPKGRKNDATIRKQAIEAAMHEQIMEVAATLIASQIQLARGVSYLYKIKFITDKKGRKRKINPILVTDPEEIKDYLAGRYEANAEYRYIATDKPDNRAIDSMLDRVWGKAVQKTEISGPDGKPLFDEVARAKANKLLDDVLAHGNTGNKKDTG